MTTTQGEKMNTNYLGKVIKIGNSLGITIPKNNREILELKEGDLVDVSLSSR